LSRDIADPAAAEILEKAEATIGADVANCIMAVVAIIADVVISIN
jgi:hypothetical protein